MTVVLEGVSGQGPVRIERCSVVDISDGSDGASQAPASPWWSQLPYLPGLLLAAAPVSNRFSARSAAPPRPSVPAPAPAPRLGLAEADAPRALTPLVDYITRRTMPFRSNLHAIKASWSDPIRGPI